jgi:thymidine phosphorylase
MVVAQGGDPGARMPVAAEIEEVRADRDGYVTELDAYGMGVAAWRLGAGRARKEDPVSPPAGILLRRRRGDRVKAGDVLYELHTEDKSRMPAGRDTAAAAIRIGDTAPESGPLVMERIAS